MAVSYFYYALSNYVFGNWTWSLGTVFTKIWQCLIEKLWIPHTIQAYSYFKIILGTVLGYTEKFFPDLAGHPVYSWTLTDDILY